MKKLIIFLMATSVFLMVSCTTQKAINTTVITPTINLALIKDAQPNKYINLDYGIKLNVKDERSYEKASRIVL